jgi:hypothetical protein
VEVAEQSMAELLQLDQQLVGGAGVRRHAHNNLTSP